jgi:hypothetical protein
MISRSVSTRMMRRKKVGKRYAAVTRSSDSGTLQCKYGTTARNRDVEQDCAEVVEKQFAFHTTFDRNYA